MRKITRFIKFHRKPILLVLLGLACILAIAYALMSRSPSTFWLPNTAYSSDGDVLYLLPIKEQHQLTTYGRGVVFRSDYGTAVYEFTANPLLDASKCPDITGRSSLEPTKCEVQGSFNGSKLYGMSRNDASSLTEQYIQVGRTFIYIVANFNSNADYIYHFVPIPQNKLNSYLAATQAIAGPIIAHQQQAQATANQKSTIAYTKLPFTPDLPKTLPADWHMLAKITGQPIRIDGPDVDHPMLLNTDYTFSKNSREDVEFYVGMLSAFRLGNSCGPTPGYSMQNLPCVKVPDTDYYEARQYDNLGDLVRYLYRPLGDSLIITEVELVHNSGPKPTLSPDLEETQNAITSAAQPVDKMALKGSAYSKTFY